MPNYYLLDEWINHTIDDLEETLTDIWCKNYSFLEEDTETKDAKWLKPG